MPRRFPHFLCALILVSLGPWALGASEGEDAAASFFEKRVRPLLVERCYQCHSLREGAKVKGGLRLDHRGGWEKGGDSGPALSPGRVDESLLVRAVRYRDPDLQMPPKGKLASEEIAVLEQWIAQGAFDPREALAENSEAGGQEKRATRGPAEDSLLWAFRSLEDPAVPPVEDGGDWPESPLDAFLLRHWSDRGVSPAILAETAVPSDKLARRLSYALTGLPPAVLELPQEETGREDARERWIDRLLASPRYGERWGRHWLDVARFADSNGMDENMAYVEAYRYRDYVIEAFNADLPFDRFVVEQLAGDLLDKGDKRSKVATGFLAIGPKMLACDDPQKMRMDIVDEQIDTMGRAFLGMTFGCARCHDHKFDPISTVDYYGLAGIFMSTKTLVNYNVVAKWHEYDLSPPEIRRAHEEIEELRRAADDKQLEPEERKGARSRMESLIAATPPRTKVMGVTENAITDARVHLRGNYRTLGAETIRQVPAVFSDDGSTARAPAEESGRLELAQWIASRDNPLTARVIANRLWRWHFGKGLVPSTDNFGKLGSPPRDPALLDYLAGELLRGQWSIKRLQRLITTSARYRMPTTPPVGEGQGDLERELPAYHSRLRLDAESLRDSLLGLAGVLDLSMLGQLMQDEPGKYVNRSKIDEYLKIPRRSVYLPIIRSALYEPFVAFDMADPSAPNGDRRDSVVAPQSLYLMNAEQVHAAALQLAEALPAESPHVRLETLYQRVLNRSVRPAEREQALRFVEVYRGDDPWAALVRVLFASNEFLYLD